MKRMSCTLVYEMKYITTLYRETFGMVLTLSSNSLHYDNIQGKWGMVLILSIINTIHYNAIQGNMGHGVNAKH